jgi:hypothetical protein
MEVKDSLEDVTLAIINISSFRYRCVDAIHFYAHLILCDDKSVTKENITKYNMKHLGEKIELFHDLTLEEAIQLDKKDNWLDGGPYEEEWEKGKKSSNRFTSFKQCIDSGLELIESLNLACPNITLFEGSYIINFED